MKKETEKILLKKIVDAMALLYINGFLTEKQRDAITKKIKSRLKEFQQNEDKERK